MTKYQPGQSGNPRGRPPRKRAWAELIRKFGKGKVKLADGTEVHAQELIAQLTINALVTGRIVFPQLDGQDFTDVHRTLVLDANDWMRLMKETREHLEPAARQEFDLTSNGEKLDTPQIVAYIPHNPREDRAETPTPPGTVPDEPS